MAGPPTTSSGGVFISYRRQDTAAYARLLREELSRRLGAGQVFMDVDSIEVGVDFAEAIDRAVDACAILLALVGPQWLTVTDADGQRRPDDPDDTVRLEVEAALARNIRVIPVLVDNAPMPRRPQLPDSLAPLARRNALELSYNRYAYDLGRLVEAVERVLGPPGVPTAAQASPALGQTQPPVVARPDDVGTWHGTKAQARPVLLGRAGDLDQARRIANQALTVATTIPDEEGKAAALTEVAIVLTQAGDPDQAVVAALQALTSASTIPDHEDKAGTLTAVARALAKAGDADQALAIANTLPDDERKAGALTAVAKALAQAGPT